MKFMTAFFFKHKWFFLLAFTGLFGCKKFVAIDPPANSISSDVLFTTDQGANSAVAGLYSQMTRNNLSITNGGVTLFAALSSDELVNTSANSSYDQFKTNDLTSDNSALSSNFWAPAYSNIYQANVILEGLNNSKSISEATKKQVRGEMLVVRAFHYFYLLNLFSDVPYLTTTDYKINAATERTASSIIYSGIISDLLEAQQLLSESYPTSTKGRPNKWTATALLARVYLYQKEWANAEKQASDVINSGKYSLVTPLNSVFLPTSQEVIWLLQRDNSNTAEGSTFIPSSSSVVPGFVLTGLFLNAFDSGDNRKTTWLGKNTVNGQDYYYPFKYKQRSSTPVTEYEVVFRLAEMYLIRAEARANLDKVSESQADLNAIRNRAGLANSIVTDKTSLLLAIEKERRTELFAEWGHRWLDLKRTDRANTVLSTLKGNSWQTTDQLYPIPLTEIQINTSLKQNPGY